MTYFLKEFWRDCIERALIVSTMLMVILGSALATERLATGTTTVEGVCMAFVAYGIVFLLTIFIFFDEDGGSI